MKPAAFDYVTPASRAEVVSTLANGGDDAWILAGGQSLVPAMNFRLAQPAIVVDINRASDLDYLRDDGAYLAVGALVRHQRFESRVTDGPLGALLGDVVAHIAHPPIRSRGTMCGSIANADPASEWCTLALGVGADMVIEGPQGARIVPARDYFVDLFQTALAQGELLAEVRLPKLGPEWVTGFAEFSRRQGDFALAMALALVRLDGDLVAEARIVVGSVAGTPVLIAEAAAALVGERVSQEAIQEASRIAAQSVDPNEDIHASAAYRRDLIKAMVRRALTSALTPS